MHKLILTLLLLGNITWLHAQDGYTVQGEILDYNGDGIPGVTILESGSTTGTITDFEGHFSLKVSSIEAKLVVSYIGYQKTIFYASTPQPIQIVLEEDVEELDEIIVVGYGEQKKINVTGAVQQLDNESLQSRPVGTVTEMLQGRVAGMNFSSSGYGMEPGRSMSINIRGAETTEIDGQRVGSTEPYVLVDNIPGTLDQVNPEDIETISVLKDAAATAIYGARATYGVILVTTKNGKKEQKPQITYTNNFSIMNPINLPKMIDSHTFATVFNEAAINAGQSPVFSNQVLERIINHQRDPSKYPSNYPLNNDPNRYGTWMNSNANMNWVDEMVGTGFNQRHNVSMRGGSEKTQYYFSVGYFGQEGVLQNVQDEFSRFNINANISTDVSDRFTVRYNTRYAQSKRTQPSLRDGFDTGTLMHQIYRMWPTQPMYEPTGTVSEASPTLETMSGYQVKTNHDLWQTVSGEFKVNDSWKISADGSFNYYTDVFDKYRGLVYYYGPQGEKYLSNAAPNSYKQEERNSDTYTTTNIYTTYNQSFNKHNIGFVGGFQQEFKQFNYLFAKKMDVISDDVPSIGTSTGQSFVQDGRSSWSTQGFFGRFNYNYDEKYLIEFNGRYDGSSRFSPENRWGFFPSASVGWNLHKEDFFQPLEEKVNAFKLRGSWGVIGNQSVYNYYSHLSIINVQQNLSWIDEGRRPDHAYAPGLVSNDLTWESVETIDIGFDIELFNHQLVVNFDWYSKYYRNQWGPAEPVPGVIGGRLPISNNTERQTKGFELGITWSEVVNENFSYSIGGILSDYQTEVTKFNNPNKLFNTYYVGMQSGEIWGYTTEGIFQTLADVERHADQSFIHGNWGAGDIAYKDMNGNGRIDNGAGTVDDSGDMSIIGNTTPRYQFGLTLNARYKNWDFSMFWQGVAKRDVLVNGNVFYGISGGMWQSTVYESTLDYWSPDNRNAYYAKPYISGESSKNQQTQTRYLQDGKYLRLKNLQVGYSLPKDWADPIGIQRMRLYFSGENLLTFTSLHENFDPELTGGGWGSGKMYPTSMVLSMGLNLTLK